MHLDHTKDWIPKDKLVDGEIYEVHGRNCRYAIWDAAKNGFIYWRYKFGWRFWDVEYHYDDGYPHGTCKPILQMTFEGMA